MSSCQNLASGIASIFECYLPGWNSKYHWRRQTACGAFGFVLSLYLPAHVMCGSEHVILRSGRESGLNCSSVESQEVTVHWTDSFSPGWPRSGHFTLWEWQLISTPSAQCWRKNNIKDLIPWRSDMVSTECNEQSSVDRLSPKGYWPIIL